MKKAGDYKMAFTWEKQSTTTTGTGATPEGFADNGTLWGSIEVQTGIEADAYGALQAQTTAVVTLRQWPGVSAKDRLTSKGAPYTGQVWVITGVRKADNETLCDVTAFEELQLTDQ